MQVARWLKMHALEPCTPQKVLGVKAAAFCNAQGQKTEVKKNNNKKPKKRSFEFTSSAHRK